MGLFTPIALRVGRTSWLPRYLPQITRLDKRLHRLTRGRFGLLDFAGLPSLMLTVPGRRSGIPRTTPLLCVPHQGGWLIAGSNFGGAKAPVWVVNLRAATSATVGFKGRSYDATWRELTGADRDAAWSVMTATWPNYDHYQENTGRTIPVFHLTPAR